ncbi:photosystem II stability/assembly factor-like uncharacterized protein [Paenibacillus sp. V4I3]|uniref:hypothetical protein n=2 Tax=unclassified Paenibacillus TaxID=185978 RepID=UPI002782416B|nr:hypothetical protein [Paenibacillus sp. V4I3]MDQ0877499.1 photosystem II stability/assembly factor-like uncharacterized protein [Paenibacillus sp. V4I3]
MEATTTQQPSPSGTIAATAASSSTPVPAVQSSAPTTFSAAAPSPALSANPSQPAAAKPAPSKPPVSRPKPSSEPSPVKADVSRIMGMEGFEGWGMGSGRLLYTNNAGKTWEVTTPDGIGAKDRLIAADFQNTFLGFAYYLTDAKQPKLLATHRMQDGAGLPAGWETAALPTVEAWETARDVTTHSSFGLSYSDASYVPLTSSPALGQMNKSLYRTDDRGKSWTRVGDIASGISGYPTGITFRVPNEGWITATYHGQESFPLFRNKDGGKTWTVQHVDIPDEFKNGYADTLTPVFDQESNNHGLFIAQFVQDGTKTYIPYESRDSGDTWLPIKHRLTDVQASPVYHFDNLITGRAISTDGKTIYIMDTYNKEDWHKLIPVIALKGASQFFLRMDGYGCVLLNGHTKITRDGGKTWTDPA